jgi:nucleoid-associated protein YgaU
MTELSRVWVARAAAPAAFLAAVTVAVLLVRAGLRENDPVRPAEPDVVTVAPGRAFHRIRRGDTLAAIASRYETTVRRLRLLNPALDPARLRVGDRIRVR